jgi:hypothetical protein
MVINLVLLMCTKGSLAYFHTLNTASMVLIESVVMNEPSCGCGFDDWWYGAGVDTRSANQLEGDRS